MRQIRYDLRHIKPEQWKKALDNAREWVLQAIDEASYDRGTHAECHGSYVTDA